MSFPWGLISEACKIGATFCPALAPELLAGSALADSAPKIIADAEVVIADIHPAIAAFHAAAADLAAHMAATAPEKVQALHEAAQAVVVQVPKHWTGRPGQSGMSG